MSERPFPIDFATFEPDARPRRWLVLPAGFQAEAHADQDSPVWADAHPAALLEAFTTTALSQPRTTLVREGSGQVELVQKSAVFRFPDYITAQAVTVQGGAALCVYSRAVLGYSDLGVNAKRIRAWLTAMPKAV